VENEAWLIGEEAASGILHRGGTILGTTNRDNPFRFRVTGADGKVTYEDRSADALRHVDEWNLDGLIVVGGDGSLTLAHRFTEMGVPVIVSLKQSTTISGLPKLLLVLTRRWPLLRMRSIACIHCRIPSPDHGARGDGRNAGWIALQAGMAGGGDIS